MSPDQPNWRGLLRAAEAEVVRVQQRLPAALREQALAVPVSYEEWPSQAQLEDGLTDDLMGLFVGLPYPEAESGALDVPPQIFLFLGNIWEEAEGDHARFCEEVRTTYFHELGHYLGLEEDDLEDRDLA